SRRASMSSGRGEGMCSESGMVRNDWMSEGMCRGGVTPPLHIEQKMHDIGVLNHVVLSFGAHEALFLGRLPAAAGAEILERQRFGANKPLFEVGVDDTGRLGGLPAPVDGPGAGLLFPCGEVGL